MVIRLGDELSLGQLRIVIAHEGRMDQRLGADEQTLGRDTILERRAGVSNVDRLIEDLCSFRVMDRARVHTKPSVQWLGDSLTPVGQRLMEYLRE